MGASSGRDCRHLVGCARLPPSRPRDAPLRDGRRAHRPARRPSTRIDRLGTTSRTHGPSPGGSASRKDGASSIGNWRWARRQSRTPSPSAARSQSSGCARCAITNASSSSFTTPPSATCRTTTRMRSSSRTGSRRRSESRARPRPERSRLRADQPAAFMAYRRPGGGARGQRDDRDGAGVSSARPGQAGEGGDDRLGGRGRSRTIVTSNDWKRTCSCERAPRLPPIRAPDQRRERRLDGGHPRADRPEPRRYHRVRDLGACVVSRDRGDEVVAVERKSSTSPPAPWPCAERLAGAKSRRNSRRTRFADDLSVDDDLHLAVGDDVEAVADVALSEELLPEASRTGLSTCARLSCVGCGSGANSSMPRSSSSSRSGTAPRPAREPAQEIARVGRSAPVINSAPRMSATAMSSGAAIDPIPIAATQRACTAPKARASTSSGTVR